MSVAPSARPRTRYARTAGGFNIAYQVVGDGAVDVVLSPGAWTHLDLWTHRHADEPAVVHLEVPEHVRVRLPDGEGGALEEHCQRERCSHRLTRYRGEAPLSVAVTQPGRYEIHVRHESNEARVRERFVLTAERD